MKKNSRYLGALFITPFIVFILLGGIYLKAFTFLISLVALKEFYNALKKKKINPINYFGYILLIIYYLINNNFEKFMYLFVLASMLLLIVPIFNFKYSFIDVALTIFGFLYVGILFSFIPLINTKNYGNYLIWLIFIGSWGADTLAYYSGKYLGKKKLCPEVSPNKTIAGSIGGSIGSIIGCLIFGIIFKDKMIDISIIHFILIGALTGIMGQFGDLVASSIKRYVNIKDYSNLIPGHGGILDRFDSILFNSVAVFYYITFILLI